MVYATPDALSKEFQLFIALLRPKILTSPLILNSIFDQSRNFTEQQLLENFNTMVDEADETLRMISPYLRVDQVLLEVGGGIGLVYAFLRSKGFDIISIEPSSGGFGDRYVSGKLILDLAKIDPTKWLNCRIQDLNTADRKFDFIFSNFVLEHIPDLNAAFQKMGTLMKSNGFMLHRCPNYDIPFENHYNIPLFPFFPKFTEKLIPKLKGDALWDELHFTNTREIKKMCKVHGLAVSFEKGMFGWAFRRIITNPVFKSRKKGFAIIARWLDFTGLIKLLDFIPSSLSTPMTFKIVISKSENL